MKRWRRMTGEDLLKVFEWIEDARSKADESIAEDLRCVGQRLLREAQRRAAAEDDRIDFEAATSMTLRRLAYDIADEAARERCSYERAVAKHVVDLLRRDARRREKKEMSGND